MPLPPSASVKFLEINGVILAAVAVADHTAGVRKVTRKFGDRS